MTATKFRATADAIAYALGEPPQRVEWAFALVYVDTDGTEVRYFDADDEADARRVAEATNLKALERGRPGGGSVPDRAYPAYREHRELPDGTQIIGPWTPTDQEGK
jgi:hypothetical protein